MVYPLPAVLVSCGDKKGNINVMTAAWTGTICSDPPMVYVSVRKERHSHHMIQETREYVINLTTEKLAWTADFCGVRSGRDLDKFKEMKLTPVQGELQYAPMIEESPVSIECRVTNVMELGSHDMFMAEVTAVYADEQYMDEKGRFIWRKRLRWCIPMGSIMGWDGIWADLDMLFVKSRRKRGKNKLKEMMRSRCLFIRCHLLFCVTIYFFRKLPRTIASRPYFLRMSSRALSSFWSLAFSDVSKRFI